MIYMYLNIDMDIAVLFSLDVYTVERIFILYPLQYYISIKDG